MNTAMHTSITQVFDKDGFFLDPQAWTPELASDIAAYDGIFLLTPKHWSIIDYMRDHYLKTGSLTVMSHVCRINDLGPHCVNDLFHNRKEAWRISGLPNPGEEAKSYM
ncbi:MAG TPA: hypothetical protein EYN26_05230 [Chromatiales bacterium]|jgi:tRNA 2-thiouridine synthesizing protein E|nr:hypothetical protein [Chromatiaceae bacterium]HIB84171.1 hypothetical protein [Chromatiaceae bacterium]HIN82501.1 hypothetical protein [Chromatiales bacterium]HIO14940.1 hypothetical protein [Chromatiales bacterium]HIO54528.1 hypothetical protein [Chromatiales bacterium]